MKCLLIAVSAVAIFLGSQGSAEAAVARAEIAVDVDQSPHPRSMLVAQAAGQHATHGVTDHGYRFGLARAQPQRQVIRQGSQAQRVGSPGAASVTGQIGYEQASMGKLRTLGKALEAEA